MATQRGLIKYSSALLALFFFSHGASAKSCLWKVPSDKGTLFLLGSVHLLKDTDYPLDPAIEKAYAQSDSLVFEVDMKAMQAPETQQLILAKAMLPDTRTLEGELDPEVHARLAKKLEEVGLPIAAMQKYKPWFVNMMLTMAHMRAIGLDAKLGLDQYFHRKAVVDQKIATGLETVEFQINLFDALSEKNQNACIRQTLAELKMLETMVDDLMAAWKKGDLETLEKLMKESFKEYPEMYETFVTARNKDWAKKLDKLVQRRKTTMVVVGVAHLAGEGGLLELLKTRGYSVEQL